MEQQELIKLLSKMSIEEKAGELFQLPSYYFEGGKVTGPALEAGITDEDIRLAGSCLSVTGAKRLRELQRVHMANHPHHIPMLFMADVVHGFRTIFPVPLAQGCAFDPELAERCAAAAAREAAASGVHVTFAPMADLARDARWGRVVESTGEDVFLNVLYAAAMVRGFQGKNHDLTQKGRIAACVKHFAGYGAVEAGRDYNTVDISERTLREAHIPAYRSAIDAGCELAMTSFSCVDGIPPAANRKLIRELLRRELGFSGVVISDWMALRELIIHGVAEDEGQAAQLAIDAGVDIDMGSALYIKHLKELVESGALSEALLDEAVLRVLTLKNKLGLFENPFKDADEKAESDLLLCQEHRELARECAERSFVLLQNKDDLLPLSCEESILFAGPYCRNQLLSGSWSLFGNDEDCATLEEGIRKYLPEEKVTFTAGCPLVDPDVELMGFQKQPPREKIDSRAALQETVALAARADKVVLALGEPRDQSGECASKASLVLPECQMELLRQVCRVNSNVCVVLFGGRPLEIREVTELAGSVLMAWLPGTEGADALARVLLGESAPSGRLAMSFPWCVGQEPLHYDYLITGRPLIGDYRKSKWSSQYLDVPNEPLYTFGFGLTYTDFDYSSIRLDSDRLAKGEQILATVTVRNTGNRRGTETVQLYIRDLVGSVARPIRSLKGFQRITLEPGESAEVSFKITEEMLRFYDKNMHYTSEPGKFFVFIGPDSLTENCAGFILE